MLYVDGIGWMDGMVIIGCFHKISLIDVSDQGPDDNCHHGNVLPRHVDQKDEQKR